MNRRWVIPVLAVILALITTVVVVTYLQGLRRQAAVAPAVPMEAVLTARQNVRARTIISANDLEVRQIPAAGAAPTALHSVDQAANRVALTDLFQGQQVLSAMVAPPGEGLGLSYVVPKGHLAETLAVNEVVDVAGFVSPGDRVDVVGTVSQNGTQASRIFLQNVLILATAQQADQKPGQPPKVTTSVTLALTPVQSEALAQIDNDGKIRLALRPAGSTQIVETKSMTTVSAFGGAPAPAPRPVAAVVSAPRPAAAAAPAPARPSGYTVEIWRASQKQTVEF